MFLDQFAHNISRGGMFLASEEVFPPGTVIRFQFLLEEEGEELEGTGIVSWVREEGTRYAPRGMGIRFVELSPALKAWIRRITETQRKEVVEL